MHICPKERLIICMQNGIPCRLCASCLTLRHIPSVQYPTVPDLLTYGTRSKFDSAKSWTRTFTSFYNLGQPVGPSEEVLSCHDDVMNRGSYLDDERSFI